MRHPNKETVLAALSLIDSRIATKVSEQVSNNKQFSNEMSDHLIGYITFWVSGYSKTEQRKLEVLRRWLSNGAKVKVYEVRANYGYGPEVLTIESTYPEAKAQKKCYDENEPGTSHWIFATYESLIY